MFFGSGSTLIAATFSYLERMEGKTQDQIEAMEQAAAARRPQYPTGYLTVPMTKEELEIKRRTWDSWHISKEEQEKMIEMFGLAPAPETQQEPGPQSGMNVAEHISPPQATSTAIGNSHKTRRGRITKRTTKSAVPANRTTRSRKIKLVGDEDPAPALQSTSHESNQARKRRTGLQKQATSNNVGNTRGKTLHPKQHTGGQRASRRLAHKPPEFGMFSEQMVTSPSNETLLQSALHANKSDSPKVQSRVRSKKLVSSKDAKPQRISKSEVKGKSRITKPSGKNRITKPKEKTRVKNPKNRTKS